MSYGHYKLFRRFFFLRFLFFVLIIFEFILVEEKFLLICSLDHRNDHLWNIDDSAQSLFLAIKHSDLIALLEYFGLCITPEDQSKFVCQLRIMRSLENCLLKRGFDSKYRFAFMALIDDRDDIKAICAVCVVSQ